MSADNWGICPKCIRVKNKRIEEAYGKVPKIEYERMLEEIKKPDVRTLREDYEIYTDEDGFFSVSYYCQCSDCGFCHRFKYSEQLTKED